MHSPRQGQTVLGHESTGVVLATGHEVDHVKEGDRVMVTWVPRNEEVAKRKAEGVVISLPDGSTAASCNVFTWADHTIADEQYVVLMPEDVATDGTAIVGCAVMTGAGAVYHTAGVKEGDSVAVFGGGGVGLSAVVAAKVIGADPIIAVDLDDEKLEFAKHHGATIGVNASNGDAVDQIRALTVLDGEFDMTGQPLAGVDYAFDCIGRKVTMEQIVPAARPGAFGRSSGGVAVLVGVPLTPVELDARDILINEKKFIGSIGGSCRPDRVETWESRCRRDQSHSRPAPRHRCLAWRLNFLPECVSERSPVMTAQTFQSEIATQDALREYVGEPAGAARDKAISYLDARCRAFIDKAPFLILGTADADGRCDVSPKGDAPGFVRVLDDHTLAIPDRPGNRRADSLSNIVANPHAALLFMVPGLMRCYASRGAPAS